jgi:diadenosine tetraphosphate (Ap4A) HIT family hydrolase
MMTTPAPNTPTLPSPFTVETDCAFVAIPGKRAGYVQLAPARETHSHAEVPMRLFEAAQAWCAFMQTQASVQRMYWLQFSEVVAHLHWHLYPRFEGDTLKGPAAFEARNDEAQHMPWPLHWQEALRQWATSYDVYMHDVDSTLQGS